MYGSAASPELTPIRSFVKIADQSPVANSKNTAQSRPPLTSQSIRNDVNNVRMGKCSSLSSLGFTNTGFNLFTEIKIKAAMTTATPPI